MARWFLRVGASSGTVAKTISAYDKEISDDLYGAGSRYVSRQRLEGMLSREWIELLTQLKETRGAQTRFFSFGDTVAARNYAGTNECHGWMGIRFQDQLGEDPNDVLLHFNLLDSTNLLQQEAVGILGVNLIYAVYFQLESTRLFLEGLFQELDLLRIEVDLVELRGPTFEAWNRNELLINLVLQGLARAVVLQPESNGLPLTECFHKKSIVLEPGTFKRLDADQATMLVDALKYLQIEEKAADSLGLYVLSAGSATGKDPAPEANEIEERIEALVKSGTSVMFVRDRELYRMTALVNRYTSEPVRFVVELSLLIQILRDTYGGLEGRTLEGIARLFAQNVRVYAYPIRKSILEDRTISLSSAGWKWRAQNGWVHADKLVPAPPLGHLYSYLIASNFIVPLPASTNPVLRARRGRSVRASEE